MSRHVYRVRAKSGGTVTQARAGPRTLLFGAVPPKNSVEGDGAEGCGANPSHREGAEVKREVTGSCRERG
jgi:hypothetical protein